MALSAQTSTFSLKRILVLAAICVLTFLCYRNTLHNHFTNWDDDVYVSNDTIIRTLTPAHLKTIFTEDITKNNYHPFCMLSLAINYHFAKLNPATYYLTNVLIHIANTVLVFYLLLQLCAFIKIKDDDAFLIASLGALWFGVHPLHVESVAWIAERKDVLYTFFYLLGLVVYSKYLSLSLPQNPKGALNLGNSVIARYEAILQTNSNKWYWLTFLLFVCSCLSKPMAVVFPLSLLTLDFLSGKKLEWKLLTQKTIFFLAAIFFGLYAVYTQNRTGAIADFNKLTLAERIMYASYGFDMYLYKLFNPTFLSTFYPYPYRFTNGSLPFIYYAAPWLAIAIIALPLFITWKKNRYYFTVLTFGMSFFIANVIFVLQFISCGAAIMADRYAYVASIGIIFVTAFFVNELIKHYPAMKTAVLTVVLILSLAMAYVCYGRTAVWHNSETLLTDAVKKYPYRALLSYKWLGNYYMDQGDTDKALENYGILAKLNSADAKIDDVLGNIYRQRNDYPNAMMFYNRAIAAENNVYITYVDRAVLDAVTGDTVSCTRDFVQAMRLNKEAEKRLSETSFTMVQAQKYKPVITQYNLLLAFNPNNPFYYFYRGVAEFELNEMNSSITDFKQSLRFKSKDVSPNAAFNLAIACDSVGDEQGALQYANVATQLGLPPKAGFIEKVERKIHKKKDY